VNAIKGLMATTCNFIFILYYIIWHKKIVRDTAREEQNKNDKSYFILCAVSELTFFVVEG